MGLPQVEITQIWQIIRKENQNTVILPLFMNND